MDHVIKVEQPTPHRHSVASDANGLTFTIPAKSRWYYFPFMIFWLVGWVLMSLGVLGLFAFSIFGGLISGEMKSGGWFFPLFLFLFLVFLYALGRFGWGTFFWYVAGREVIQVNPEFLTITKRAWRWQKTRTYDLALVRNFRVNKEPEGIFSALSMKSSRHRRETISFDYGAKVQFFGQELDDAEARQIIAEISGYLAEMRPNPN
jgi:hypothetical protein